MKLISLPALLLLLSASPLFAGLSLQLDPLNREFALIGVDTGTPAEFGSDGLIRWRGGHGTSVTDANFFTSTNSAPRPLSNMVLLSHPTDFYTVGLMLYLTDFNETTIEGTGEFFSYGGFSDEMASMLESQK